MNKSEVASERVLRGGDASARAVLSDLYRVFLPAWEEQVRLIISRLDESLLEQQRDKKSAWDQPSPVFIKTKLQKDLELIVSAASKALFDEFQYVLTPELVKLSLDNESFDPDLVELLLMVERSSRNAEHLTGSELKSLLGALQVRCPQIVVRATTMPLAPRVQLEVLAMVLYELRLPNFACAALLQEYEHYAQDQLPELYVRMTELIPSLDVSAPATAKTSAKVVQLVPRGHQSDQVKGLSNCQSDGVDVTDTVNQLFQFVDQNSVWSETVKSLLNRLRMPVKAVLEQDPSALSDTTMAVQSVLKLIADLATGWAGEEDLSADPLYRELDGVMALLEQGAEGAAIDAFAQASDALRDIMKREHRRSELAIQRAQRMAQGAQHADAVEQRVSQLLNEHLSGRELPAEWMELIRNGWARLLRMLAMREAEDGKNWLVAVNTLEHLVDSGEARTAPAARISLLKALRQGLTAAGVSAEQIDRWLSAVESHWDAPEQVEGWQESSAESSDSVDLAIEMQKISALSLGAWLELSAPEDGKLRCRLAAVLSQGQRYIMVNRTGMKVGEFSREELALRLRNKTLSVLDDGSRFDSALRSVVGSLQKLKDKSA